MENIDLIIEKAIETYCELYLWKPKKTLDFKGTLKELLKRHSLTFEIEKTERDNFYTFSFNSPCGIIFISKDLLDSFACNAMKFIQMELIREGVKSQLYVQDDYILKFSELSSKKKLTKNNS